MASELDGGLRGWLVCLSAYLLYFFNGGTFYSNGLLYPEFLQTFQAGKVATTWLASVQIGICQSSGIVGGVLTELYGCRPVATAGTIFTVVGYVLSSFVTDIKLLYFTYSVIPGIGLGLQFVPAIVIVQHYFTRRRSLVTGIVSCGSPSGCFVYALFTRYLLDTYGWRGTLMLMGGMMLHAVVFIYIMEEPKGIHAAPSLTPDEEDLTEDNSRDKTSNHCNKLESCANEAIIVNQYKTSVNGAAISIDGKSLSNGYSENRNSMAILDHSSSAKMSEEGNSPKMNGFIHSPVHNRLLLADNSIREDRQFSNSPLKKRLLQLEIIRSDKSQSLENEKSKIGVPLKNNVRDSSVKLEKNESEQMQFCQHDKEFPSPENTSLRVENEMSINKSGLLQADRKCQATGLAVELDEVFCRTKKCSFFHEFAIAGKHICDGFLELKEPVCLLMFLGAVFVCMGYQVPYLFLPTKCLQLGYSPWSAALLISTMGITDAVGRIIFGYLGNFRRPGKMYLLTISTFTCGLSCFLFGLTTNYELLLTLCVTYGLSVSCFIALTAPVLVDLLGLERIARLFGLINLGYGIGFLLSPPAEAYLYEVTNNINTPFYVGSALQIPAVAAYILTMHISSRHKAVAKPVNEMEVGNELSTSHDRGVKRSANDSESHLGSVQGSNYQLTASVQGSSQQLASGSPSCIGSVRSIHSANLHLNSSSILFQTPLFGSVMSLNSHR